MRLTKIEIFLIVCLVGSVGFLTYTCSTLPSAPWGIGDTVCFKANGAQAQVRNYTRWGYGVTYHLTAVDDHNRVYTVEVDITALESCP